MSSPGIAAKPTATNPLGVATTDVTSKPPLRGKSATWRQTLPWNGVPGAAGVAVTTGPAGVGDAAGVARAVVGEVLGWSVGAAGVANVVGKTLGAIVRDGGAVTTTDESQAISPTTTRTAIRTRKALLSRPTATAGDGAASSATNTSDAPRRGPNSRTWPECPCCAGFPACAASRECAHPPTPLGRP